MNEKETFVLFTDSSVFNFPETHESDLYNWRRINVSALMSFIAQEGSQICFLLSCPECVVYARSCPLDAIPESKLIPPLKHRDAFEKGSLFVC